MLPNKKNCLTVPFVFRSNLRDMFYRNQNKNSRLIKEKVFRLQREIRNYVNIDIRLLIQRLIRKFSAALSLSLLLFSPLSSNFAMIYDHVDIFI